MARMSQRVLGRATLAFVVLVAGIALCGCGGSGDNGSAEVAKQEELRAAREQAAQDARQGAKIAELERKLKHTDRSSSDAGTRASAPAPTSSVSQDEPLSGLWKGEAVIEYNSGKSDPFEQTIQIEALVPGQVAGYSEAVQGSTTCHGPITFEGTSEGSYRFSSDEQNKAECIDSSEVELMPLSSGALEYRESTDVSLSTGTLERVR